MNKNAIPERKFSKKYFLGEMRMDFVLYAIEDYIVGRNFIEKFLVVKDRLLRYNRKKLSTGG